MLLLLRQCFGCPTFRVMGAAFVAKGAFLQGGLHEQTAVANAQKQADVSKQEQGNVPGGTNGSDAPPEVSAP